MKTTKQFYQFLIAVLIFCALILFSVLTVNAAEGSPSVGSEATPAAEPQDSELPPDIFDDHCDGGASCPGRVFSDMPKVSHWSHLPIDWALTHHITGGTGANTFSPNKSCTRAEIVMFLWRALGSRQPSITSCSFTDVKSSAYYYTAVLWAAENGVVGGTSATTFSPNRICTRAQTVTFLWAAAGRPTPEEGGTNFRDVSANAYYRDAVRWASQNAITSGVSNNQFNPDGECSRCQVVTFLYRLMKLGE